MSSPGTDTLHKSGALFPGYCSPTLEPYDPQYPAVDSHTTSSLPPPKLSLEPATDSKMISPPQSNSASSTQLFNPKRHGFDILAEAAKRAEMSLLIGDFDKTRV